MVPETVNVGIVMFSSKIKSPLTAILPKEFSEAPLSKVTDPATPNSAPEEMLMVEPEAMVEGCLSGVDLSIVS